jgi:hypothetical protein
MTHSMNHSPTVPRRRLAVVEGMRGPQCFYHLVEVVSTADRQTTAQEWVRVKDVIRERARSLYH